MKKKLHAFLRDEEALTIVEYAVAAGLIISVLILALLALGVSVNAIITTVSDRLTP